MKVENPSAFSTLSVVSIFDNSRENNALNGQAFSETFDLRLKNSYNHASVPGQHMWASQAPRPNSKCSKTVEV